MPCGAGKLPLDVADVVLHGRAGLDVDHEVQPSEHRLRPRASWSTVIALERPEKDSLDLDVGVGVVPIARRNTRQEK